ncbi:alanyl-tRNA ligase [Listeria cornellensis FSL F6-0969]|uniref:alanine--tRNA ligase n=1 Tax=Listeria cornellensis FSL F6-0969 TaxID=1265820 RepID=W7BUC6_9LIST|nr:alanyl-tRNA ligase [Listeria cornellensis FSL F6-0969]
MKQLTSAEVRQMFLDFFQEKGHKVEPSAPLVPINDASLLWINSGVATLKKYFDGSVIPDNPRITNAQKSIRTNDIENVGKTARHHTFFEMLGNFSIGEYFKEEAIVWAWEFLTSPQWIGFDPDKLYVTVYPEDEEAKTIWKEKVGLTDDHIVPIEDNFWDIGEGPSGPDSEIFLRPWGGLWQRCDRSRTLSRRRKRALFGNLELSILAIQSQRRWHLHTTSKEKH